jgi:hypothetical protein
MRQLCSVLGWLAAGDLRLCAGMESCAVIAVLYMLQQHSATSGLPAFLHPSLPPCRPLLPSFCLPSHPHLRCVTPCHPLGTHVLPACVPSLPRSFQPSPFFVLDEVDAALDATNVVRVANYLRHMTRSDTQGCFQVGWWGWELRGGWMKAWFEGRFLVLDRCAISRQRGRGALG